MKIVHLISLLLVVLGGVHAVLGTIGMNLFGTVFGGGMIVTVLQLVIGIATIYYVFPLLKTRLG